MECLENRLTLSGSPVLVTSSADSWQPGSLRDAIANAVSGETIEFARSVHSIKLTSGESADLHEPEYRRARRDKLTISGNDASRVFDIQRGDCDHQRLTIADGMVNTTSTRRRHRSPGAAAASSMSPAPR